MRAKAAGDECCSMTMKTGRAVPRQLAPRAAQPSRCLSGRGRRSRRHACHRPHAPHRRRRRRSGRAVRRCDGARRLEIRE
eukprot:5020500-Pleurochrysis_carterae.AAC.1